MKQTIIVDLDAVIGDTIPTMNKLFSEKYGRHETIEVPHAWNWAGSPPEHKEFAMGCFADVNYYSKLLPVPGAANALKALRTKFNVHIMTARSCLNATEPQLQKVTLDWLERHGMTYDAVAFAADKLALVQHLYGPGEVAYIVEDNGKTALTFAEAGIPALLITFPYNQEFEHKNIVRVSSLMSAAASTLLALEEMEQEQKAA